MIELSHNNQSLCAQVPILNNLTRLLLINYSFLLLIFNLLVISVIVDVINKLMRG